MHNQVFLQDKALLGGLVRAALWWQQLHRNCASVGGKRVLRADCVCVSVCVQSISYHWNSRAAAGISKFPHTANQSFLAGRSRTNTESPTLKLLCLACTSKFFFCWNCFSFNLVEIDGLTRSRCDRGILPNKSSAGAKPVVE